MALAIALLVSALMVANSQPNGPGSGEGDASAADPMRTPLPQRALSGHDVESLLLALRRPRASESLSFQTHLVRLTANMLKHPAPESGGMDVPGQLEHYIELAQLARVQTLCEIGFNGGHSAGAFLQGGPLATTFVSFDVVEHAYTEAAWGITSEFWGVLRRTLGEPLLGVAFHVVRGDSAIMGPSFFANHSEIACDLFHVDGHHGGEHPAIDLRTAIAATRPGALVVMDDVMDPTVDAKRRHRRGAALAWGGEVAPTIMTAGPTGAWDAAVAEGRILEVERTVVGGRGWAVGIVPLPTVSS